MLEKFFLFLLKKISPELAHKIVIFFLSFGMNRKKNLSLHQGLSVKIFGKKLSHPIGLAAGFDKNAEALKGLIKLNFSFIEVGTVTPKPQAGNTKPRIFRFNKEESILNSLGFPNIGAIRVLKNIEKVRKYHSLGKEPLIGINIGFNKCSINPTKDYILCLNIFFKVADYITINISSPNTPGLRSFQEKEKLKDLLKKINFKKKFLEKKYKRLLPLAIKIAPDIDEESLKSIVSLCEIFNCDAIIATNTSVNKKLLMSHDLNNLQGGLSGKSLFHYSNKTLKKLKKYSSNEIKIIGVGGVSSLETVREKILLGAHAVQIYSGLIFKGPTSIIDILKELNSYENSSNNTNEK